MNARRILPVFLLLALFLPGACWAEVTITGELMCWHKVTLTLDGPQASERDRSPNPYTDYQFEVQFTHESGTPSYTVPGYFAADGDAANTSATEGNKWRAHLSPDKAGVWTYQTSFIVKNAEGVATPLAAYSNLRGKFEVALTDKQGRDFRGKGRLTYVGKHHLRFAGDGSYFLKCGADAPETLLAYEDFDDTVAMIEWLPVKSWQPHVQDWRSGDPTWGNGKGKGLIGAVNYLASTGANCMSFIPYNAGGDGDNVWPFVERNEKLHYDCSKLDQWQIVFDHAQERGVFLHFKMQETEQDDNQHPERDGPVVESLDGGDLGPERKLYIREFVARFGYALAMNWNLGEENSQTPDQQRAMASYLRELDPYDHHIVIQTFPDEQNKVYTPLLGDQSELTGVALQNDWRVVHRQTLKWLRASSASGKPWVVCNDEQNHWTTGTPPDPGYDGYDGTDREGNVVHTVHDIRKHVLWGNLMAGGGGVEHYFGWELPQSDLLAEDWRSRAMTWNFGKIALAFFHDNEIPFWEMTNRNDLIGASDDAKTQYCLARTGGPYLVYTHGGTPMKLDLASERGAFRVEWFNPRTGGELARGSVNRIRAGSVVSLGAPPSDADEDWLAIVRRK